MGNLALARLEKRLLREGVAVVEHPLRSWLWRFPRARRLMLSKGIFFTVLFHQMWGGKRFKAEAWLHNCKCLHDFFHHEGNPPVIHGLTPYKVHLENDGTLRFDTKEEAQYPQPLCEAYARVVTHYFDLLRLRLIPREVSRQGNWLREQLIGASQRLGEERTSQLVAQELEQLLRLMRRGQEAEHLHFLVRHVDRRGSDIKLWNGELLRAISQQAPYPAFRWAWQAIASYPWKSPSHINVLELAAFVNFVKQAVKSKAFLSKRFVHVLDSTVAAAVITKGRSSSKRLNRQLRELAGLLLAADSYPFVVWTISAWNFSDKASRRHEAAS